MDPIVVYFGTLFEDSIAVAGEMMHGKAAGLELWRCNPIVRSYVLVTVLAAAQEG